MGIYDEAMKGGILGGDISSIARSRRWQLMVRGTPRHVTRSRLSWVWTLSPNPLVHPLPVAASPSLEVFLRNTHLSLPSHLSPSSFPRRSEKDGHVTRPCPHRGAPPGVQRPRSPVSHALPYLPTGALRSRALSPAPEPSCWTPQALSQPSGGTGSCLSSPGSLGAISGKPPSTRTRASGKRAKHLYKQWSVGR